MGPDREYCHYCRGAHKPVYPPRSGDAEIEKARTEIEKARTEMRELDEAIGWVLVMGAAAIVIMTVVGILGSLATLQ
jgi:hypothetical protein